MSANSYAAVDEMTRPLSDEEKRVEKLAMFLVDELHLLPSNEAIGRFSGGHGWHRASASEQEAFRHQARAMLATLREIGFEVPR